MNRAHRGDHGCPAGTHLSVNRWRHQAIVAAHELANWLERIPNSIPRRARSFVLLKLVDDLLGLNRTLLRRHAEVSPEHIGDELVPIEEALILTQRKLLR